MVAKYTVREGPWRQFSLQRHHRAYHPWSYPEELAVWGRFHFSSYSLVALQSSCTSLHTELQSSLHFLHISVKCGNIWFSTDSLFCWEWGFFSRFSLKHSDCQCVWPSVDATLAVGSAFSCLFSSRNFIHWGVSWCCCYSSAEDLCIDALSWHL